MYIGEVKYDESAEIYAMPLAIKIENQNTHYIQCKVFA